MANGRVTLIAHDVTVREILAEWARVGQARIVNGEKLTGGPVTIELTDVPEARALDTVLRSAAGYVMAPRDRWRARPVALRPHPDPRDQPRAVAPPRESRAVRQPADAAAAAVTSPRRRTTTGTSIHRR